MMQFLDSVLCISSTPIDLAESIGFVVNIDDRETFAILGIATQTPHHRGLDDDPASVRPFPRSVEGLSQESLGLGVLARNHTRRYKMITQTTNW
jgi:hypothetical protein